ncbi:MAG TPA: winged helix-turn-helix domain-containing protein [Phocaeicola coprocola]|uniref:Winged helix-turn-helix domain-containing protein n=1 Tax=Phocaeicola coprocola TaxID=310298 RepID=A0A921K4E8_9BACT|nr:winged helix-turn-helix domain-containing protein [Phocaeicola coprocola]
MNCKLLSVAVFLTLMLTSLLAGRHNYCKARNEITADLNQALAQTLKERKDYIITQDTIRVYKQLRKTSGGQVLIAVSDERFCRYLKDKRLQQAAFITFDVVDNDFQDNSLDEQAVCSDTLIVKDKHAGETLALKGYARLSVASILGMSDQRIPAACMISAFLWAMLSWLYLRKKQEEPEVVTGFGGLVYSEVDQRFYTAAHTPIRFTPMQQQLMLLFWNAPSHSLTKEDICAALWPKKEDANDTLYTLIRRLKPIVEEHTNLKIVADRGRNYSLEINKI